MKGGGAKVNAARPRQKAADLYQNFAVRVYAGARQEKDHQQMGVEPFENNVTGQRSAKRARVLLAAHLHTPDGIVPARLRDLSRKGALIECVASAKVGSSVLFERGAIKVSATVAWIADGRIGLEFDHPIQESELLIHIGRPERTRSPQPYFGRPGIMRGMSAKNRRIAEAWSVAVGLTVPDKES